MRFCLLLISIIIHQTVYAQKSTYVSEIKTYQHKLNHEFADPTETPLTEEGLARFDSLNFFKINATYLVKAYLVKTPKSKPFKMLTTTNRKPDYRQYGTVSFMLKDTLCTLSVFENLRFKSDTTRTPYLFLPFKDYTNGGESYGGGRFLDLKIPADDTLHIDFNKAYNPYCAYSARYSCPIPPKENELKVHIAAGVMRYDGEH